MKSALVVGFMFALASPAFAQTDSATQSAAPAAEAPSAEGEVVPAATPDAEKSKKICRNERPIGSNRSQRVCRTREQIQMQSDMSRDAMTEVGRRRDSASGGDL